MPSWACTNATGRKGRAGGLCDQLPQKTPNNSGGCYAACSVSLLQGTGRPSYGTVQPGRTGRREWCGPCLVCGARECGRKLRVYSPPDLIFVRGSRNGSLQGPSESFCPAFSWGPRLCPLCPWLCRGGSLLCLVSLLPLKLPGRAHVALTPGGLPGSRCLRLG